jgi:hypothetical protein
MATRLQLRSAWQEFLHDVPLPALWVSAHIGPIRGSTGILNPALRELITYVGSAAPSDAKAAQYRTFLQKTLTPLNRKILKSRDASRAFGFRGVLERNTDDANGSRLHYHFLLWEPNGLFAADPSALTKTADCLRDLWWSKVPVPRSRGFEPIDIQIVTDREVLSRIVRYEMKHNPLTDAYELFDDWSTSLQSDSGTNRAK